MQDGFRKVESLREHQIIWTGSLPPFSSTIDFKQAVPLPSEQVRVANNNDSYVELWKVTQTCISHIPRNETVPCRRHHTAWANNTANIMWNQTGKHLRGKVKYYFADFVRKREYPPPLRTKFSQKNSYGFGGYPPPPFTDKIRKVVFDHLPKVSSCFIHEQPSQYRLTIYRNAIIVSF